MQFKSITSSFVALVSAVLLVPLLGAGSLASAVPSAFQPAGIPYSGSQTGVLEPRPASFNEGQEIEFLANFPSSAAGKSVTFYAETGNATNDFESIGTDSEANRYGNAYLNDYVVNDDQRVFARVDSTGEVTQLESLNPRDPSEFSATLDPDFEIVGSVGQDAKAYATWSPVDHKEPATLQVKSIKDGTWRTVDTAYQGSSGMATFFIGNPLEVEHQYRAVSGGITTNTVSWAGPLNDKNNDIPTVHFNTNDGETVNTRDKWFKGEFSILPGTTDQNKDGALENCGAVNKIDGEMRGRGNYSWSFAKKGFNLKFGDSIDLCGMGKSKKWALVANHYDRSLLRNSAAGFVGKIFTNLEWTPKDSAVDFYHNGSFRGSYILIERVNLEGGRLDRPELKAEKTPEICPVPIRRWTRPAASTAPTCWSGTSARARTSTSAPATGTAGSD